MWKNPHGKGLNGAERIPYNLPAILEDKHRGVFICEGEKDCDTLIMHGFLATTYGGASDVPDNVQTYLRGRRVFICGDFDKAGGKFVKSMYEKLNGVAQSVAHCWLQNPAQSESINDMTDWFAHGGSADKLKAQVKSAKGYEAFPEKPQNLIMTYHDILNMPPPVWLVKNYLLQNSTAMIWGRSGSFKSFMALDIGLSISTGKDFHGCETTQKDVLYIAGEGGYGYKNRIAAYQKHYNLEIKNFYLMPIAVDLIHKELVDILINDVQLLKLDLGLLIIDTMARNFSGEENSAKDTSMFIQNLDDLRDVLGCTILIVHHSGKNEASGARGSSNIYASMDTSIQVARVESVCVLTCDKQKDSAPFEQIEFEMQTVNSMDGESLVAVPTETSVDFTHDEQVYERLKTLLLKEGETKNHKDIPKHQRVIARARLREECLDLFDGKSNTKSKAFGRCLERLIHSNRILFSGTAMGKQMLWIKDKNQEIDIDL